ncbi:MAG: hypothetical protein K8R25_04110 [Methanosarcinales archaeon]|nr:hypothetical protein [Methanosarcinales archaeon]
MVELMNIISIIVFLVFILLNLFIMLFISSYLAVLMMIFIPVLIIIILPDIGIEFFGYEQAKFLDGTVIINNLHILLFIWSTLLGIVVYTEVVSWYISGKSFKLKLGRSKEPQEEFSEESSGEENVKTPKKKPKQKSGIAGKKVNIPFKPLERFLMKLERLIGGKK